jgi:vacuolar protein sorting-associated protein IST1
MFSSKPKFNHDKCKVQLKMLISRIKMQLNKQTNLAKAERRVIAGLLRESKEHQARIKVEQIIRADFKLESLELINNYTELLISRFSVLVTEPEMKPEIAEAVTALVYAGYLLGNEIPELKELFNLFTAKYGKEYTEQVVSNKDKYLAYRFNKVLTSSQVPDTTVVVAYLQEIVKTYGVEYVPTLSAQPPPHISATTGLVLPLPGEPMGPAPGKIDLGPPVGGIVDDAGRPVPYGASTVPTAAMSGVPAAISRMPAASQGLPPVGFTTTVTNVQTVKHVAIDTDGDGHADTMMQQVTNQQHVNRGPGLYDAYSLGGLPPSMEGASPAPPPYVPPALQSTLKPNKVGNGSLGTSLLGGDHLAPLIAPPFVAPSHVPPPIEEDADDQLARRLAALKR